MHKIKNLLPQPVWINLPDKEGKLRDSRVIPPRQYIILNDEQFNSKDVQAKLHSKPPVLREDN